MSEWRPAVALRGMHSGYIAVAYRIGALDPEPTREDVATGQLFSFLWGQRDINPDVVSAIGYTVEFAFANLARYVDGPLVPFD